MVYPDLAPSKKRKLKNISKTTNDEEEFIYKLIDEFEHEDKLKPFYSKATELEA
jgi:hypothetical protein